MPNDRSRVLRLVPELRAVHLERHRSFTPGRLLFLDRKYDATGLELPDGVTRVSFPGALRAVWSSDAEVFEMPEPLWMRFQPRGVPIALAWKLGGLVRRRARRTVTHAMENNRLDVLIGGGRRIPRAVTWLYGAVVGLYVRLVLDRISFATPDARALYRSLPFVRGVAQRLFVELPAALPSAEAEVAAPTVTFVGLLAERNGVVPLLEAWEIVERRRPGARLRIVGGGDLQDRVRAWASTRPASRCATGPRSRDDVLSDLGRSRVLVAPSLPEGRYREQVSLPVKEALSRGVTVVVTRQTGLCPWLAEHGHHVVDVDGALVESLADAVVDALDAPLDRRDVRTSLPTVEGRQMADAWLTAPHM